MGFFKNLFKSGDKGSGSTSAADPSIEEGPAAKGVLITTSMGDITVALYSDKAPKACKNFATLCDTHKYDNCPFHRIIPGFMIQGGDFTRQDGTGGKSIWGKKFEDEFDASLHHDRKGVLSMANSGPKTNGSQFFITLDACGHLDGKHTIFGQVVEGMDIVDKLGSVKTGELDRPVKEVMIVKAQSFT